MKDLNSFKWLNIAVTRGIICTGYVFYILCSSKAIAQIAPDNTLLNNSNVQTIGNTIRINGGTTAGSNLFHSFSEFSVPTGSTADFNNSLNIQNIISRVTGKSLSNIDGLIRANGTANLFLINPNGIIFGQNARLDIGGSFGATTANAIGFGERGFFSATNPNTPELLTINPTALLFNQIRAASIENKSVAPSGFYLASIVPGLRVPDGKSLLLVGGDIKIDGGGLFAFGGRVELGGLASVGIVGLNGNGNDWSLSFPDNVERSDIFLTNGAEISATARNGGSIAFNTRNLNITDKSNVSTGIDSGVGSNNKAGNISINATVAVNLTNDSIIANQVRLRANGQGGDININTGTLKVESGSQISTSTRGAGKGGSLRVNAQDVQLIGTSASNQFASSLSASAQRNSTGDAGDLTIKTNTLLVRDGAQVSTITFTAGKGGSLSIDAQDVQVNGRSADDLFGSALNTSAQMNSTGDAGNLTIKTNTLFVGNGAQVGAATFGTGKGGNVTIKTNTLLVKGGAQVISNTLGAGKGGSLSVDAQDVQLIGTDNQFVSALNASAQRNSTGDAGSLTIKTNTLLVRDGAQVGVTTLGAGKGGSLSIDAQDVQLIGRTANNRFPSTLTTSARQNSTGNAGDLTINTNTFLVRDGAEVIVNSLGRGTAGNMTLNARSIRLNNNAALNANTQAVSTNPNIEQATINLRSQNLILLRGSSITTNAKGENVIGGNININTDVLVAFANSDISANSSDFRGGNVKINTTGIFGTQFRNALTLLSDITATGANPQLNGTVQINTPDVDPSAGLVELPVDFVDRSGLMAQGCPANRGNSFTITGRGGLPPLPTDALRTNQTASVNWVRSSPLEKNGISVSENSHIRRERSHKNHRLEVQPIVPTIVEANGWVTNKSGTVELIAFAPTQSHNNTSTNRMDENLMEAIATCRNSRY